jgi:riboflavin synthase
MAEYVFKYEHDDVTVPKGSITVNGVSLTVVQSEAKLFSVHIIPYTVEHTNFHTFKVGTKVNLEFDIIGKYVKRMMSS